MLGHISLFLAWETRLKASRHSCVSTCLTEQPRHSNAFVLVARVSAISLREDVFMQLITRPNFSRCLSWDDKEAELLPISDLG
jgi:hypothetical protein